MCAPICMQLSCYITCKYNPGVVPSRFVVQYSCSHCLSTYGCFCHSSPTCTHSNAPYSLCSISSSEVYWFSDPNRS